MSFDSLIDILAQLLRLDWLLLLKDEGYRDGFFFVVGTAVGLTAFRLVASLQVRHWRSKAEEHSAKRDEARDRLEEQIKASEKSQRDHHAARSELTTARAAIADQEIEIRALKTQLAEQIPEGGKVVSEATLQRLVDGRIWSRDVAPEHLSLVHQRSRIPILAVGNLKGGVGKTTVTANLGAVFARSKGYKKRTLFVDVDFQSSLSRLLNGVSRQPETERVADLMDPSKDVSTRLINAKLLNVEEFVPGCEYYDCNMNVTLLEDRITLRWLLRDLEGGAEAQNHDVRLILKEFLLSDKVQERYDLVIIDLPPRNSALSYNALCAATHLLIVTRPDTMSSDSVERFATYLENSRKRLFPHLKVAGVVVNGVSGHHKDWQRSLGAGVAEAFSVWSGEIGERDMLGQIKQATAISNTAGSRFAVLDDREVRTQFEALAESLHLFPHEDR